MSILVLGARGLLGSTIKARFPDLTALTSQQCDITSIQSISKALDRYSPDAVINATGIVKGNDPELMGTVNALGPLRLQQVCDLRGIKIVQVSTDCVYDATSTPVRTEQIDPVRPAFHDHPYAASKLLGELTDPPHITVRTSFVGWPDWKGNGLLAWFYMEEGSIQGYRQVFWNGLTAWELADHLVYLATSSWTGLLHLGGECVSKYDLLNRINALYGWKKHIEPVDDMMHDRCLSSVRTDYPRLIPPLNAMLRDMMQKESYIWDSLSP